MKYSAANYIKEAFGMHEESSEEQCNVASCGVILQ